MCLEATPIDQLPPEPAQVVCVLVSAEHGRHDQSQKWVVRACGVGVAEPDAQRRASAGDDGQEIEVAVEDGDGDGRDDVRDRERVLVFHRGQRRESRNGRVPEARAKGVVLAAHFLLCGTHVPFDSEGPQTSERHLDRLQDLVSDDVEIDLGHGDRGHVAGVARSASEQREDTPGRVSVSREKRTLRPSEVQRKDELVAILPGLRTQETGARREVARRGSEGGGRHRLAPGREVQLGDAALLGRLEEPLTSVELAGDREELLVENRRRCCPKEEASDSEMDRLGLIVRDELVGSLLHAVVEKPDVAAGAEDQPLLQSRSEVPAKLVDRLLADRGERLEIGGVADARRESK